MAEISLKQERESQFNRMLLFGLVWPAGCWFARGVINAEKRMGVRTHYTYVALAVALWPVIVVVVVLLACAGINLFSPH